MHSAHTFAEVLRRHRVAAGLSQEALAERAGISLRGLSDLERGISRAPRLHTLGRLADALALDPAARQALTVAGGYPPANAQAPESEFIAASAARVAIKRALPGYLTGLLGRERDVTAVGDLLRRREVRLVTLTGPGGVGKTRLAVKVAAELEDLFTDGVAFVPLAPLRDAGLIPAAIAQALGVGETGELPVVESLAAALANQRLLLVLDNFEHLLAGAPVVADLLVRCPGLKVLTTSRAQLRLSGEHSIPVQPLAVPDLIQAATPHAAADWPSVVLFVERARAVQPAFTLTPDNMHTVLGICQRLDGLPLALELAAARISVLSPAALLVRLEQRLPLLTSGPRDAPERHRALRDAIAWSYDLLSESEQRLFRRLSVFAGGWTLTLAEEVAGEAADTAAGMDDLFALVEHSLVEATADAGGEPRFGLLETLREHALERLEASGEAAAVRRRHAEAFLRLAEEAEPFLVSAERVTWLRRIDSELANVRAALAWTLTPEGDADLGLRLMGSVSWFWYLRGRLQEGRMWSERLLATTDRPTSAAARARTLYTLGGILLMMMGHAREADAALQESADLFRAETDARRLAHALTLLGLAATSQRQLARAQALYREAVTLARANGNTWLEALALASDGAAAELAGEPASAQALYQSSLTLFEQLDDYWGRALAQRELGGLASARGDFAAAGAAYAQSVALFRQSGDERGLAQALLGQGRTALQVGAVEQAHELLTETLQRWRDMGLRVGIVRSIAGLADVAAAQGDYARATRLYAAAATDAADYDRALARLQAHVDHASFTAAWATGLAMSLDEAVTHALAESST